jgi:hypothetical protein
MTPFALSWAISDQERDTLIPDRPTHEHKWSQWFRADPRQGKISNRFQRRCNCGRIQYARGTQWGGNIRLECEI